MLVHSWESRACHSHRNKMTCGSGMLNACIYGFSINDDNNSWHRYVGPFSSVAGLHVHVCQAVIHPPADESEGFSPAPWALFTEFLNHVTLPRKGSGSAASYSAADTPSCHAAPASHFFGTLMYRSNEMSSRLNYTLHFVLLDVETCICFSWWPTACMKLALP